MTDLVNHPPHYRQHPSGIEIIEVAETLDYRRGNALKYVQRAPHKGNQLQDLKKALWYLKRHFYGVDIGAQYRVEKFLRFEEPESLSTRIVMERESSVQMLENLIEGLER